MSSLFSEAPWPVCTLPAGGHVFCLCYLYSYSWQQVLSLTYLEGCSAFVFKPWGSATAMTLLHLIPCMAYAYWSYSLALYPLVSLYQCRTLNVPSEGWCDYHVNKHTKVFLYFHMKETAWNKVQHQSARLM